MVWYDATNVNNSKKQPNVENNRNAMNGTVRKMENNVPSDEPALEHKYRESNIKVSREAGMAIPSGKLSESFNKEDICSAEATSLRHTIQKKSHRKQPNLYAKTHSKRKHKSKSKLKSDKQKHKRLESNVVQPKFYLGFVVGSFVGAAFCSFLS